MSLLDETGLARLWGKVKSYVTSRSQSLTQAEYNALTPAQKSDGTVYYITDAISTEESELWSRVGRGTLHTDAQVISNAVNELKENIDTNTDDINTNTDAISELNSSLTNFKTTQQILFTSGAFAANTPRTFTLTETYNNFLLLCIEVTQYGNPLITMTIPVSYFNTTSSGNRPILNAVSSNVEVYKDGVNRVIVKSSNALTDAFHVRIYGVNRIV
jgi:hypothetical protein